MQQDDIMKLFLDYVDRMKQIRVLSTPALEDISDSNQYGAVLKENFSKIGVLARENGAVINEIIKPLMKTEGELPQEMQELLLRFDEMLVREDNFAEVDFHLSDWGFRSTHRPMQRGSWLPEFPVLFSAC